MIIPPLLSKGDTIGIVAPARKVSAGDLDLAIQMFTSWGLQVELAKHIFSDHHAYLAGSQRQRLEDIQSMIANPTVRAIIAARGGFGTTQILDEIDLSPLRDDPKWIIGFSDITALHLALVRENIASIHGAMPIMFSKPAAAGSIESLGKLLMKGECNIDVSHTRFNREGVVEGIVIGGNLSLIADSLGTSSEPDTASKILLIEEVDEYFYKLDRMMTQLKRAGKLKHLAALVVGYMTDLKDSDLAYGEVFNEIILKAVEDYDFPVAFNFPFGHSDPNHAWLHGGHATLQVSSTSSRLSFDRITRGT